MSSATAELPADGAAPSMTSGSDAAQVARSFRNPVPSSPPDLTVVIPARNAARTLPVQLRALSAATYDGRFDIVLVDDGSLDGTGEVAVRTATQLGLDLRVLTQSDPQGPSGARNAGAASTEAPRLLFCDADDMVDPGWIEAMVRELDVHPIVTGRLRTDGINEPVIAASRGDGSSAPDFGGLFAAVSSGNLGVRRAVWEELGGFDVGLDAFEDADWAARAVLAGYEIRWAPDAVVQYRFRTAPAALWRQGLRYGEHRALVARRWHEATGEHAPRLGGVGSWIWLPVHVTDLRSRPGRARWCWVAGNRIGTLIGSIRHRFMVL